MTILDNGEIILNSYNSYEEKAKEDIPIYLARCFSPLTFNSYNFLTRVTSSKELWKFADSQQEFRTSHYGLKIIKKFSVDELELIKSISMEYGELQKVFKRKTNPIGLNHQLSSLPSLRILSQLEDKLGATPAILEVGGGSGMLGHMCHRLGYQYTSFDITQSFYVFNSTIYSLMYKDSFLDTHTFSNNISYKKRTVLTNPITMIPWWHFVNDTFPLPKFNVVILNHCFFEISRKAITFIFTRLSNAVKGRVYLIVSEWGSARFTELDNNFLCWLEKEFDFRLETFKGNHITNPEGTVLLSFEKKKPSFDKFSVALEDRLKPDIFYSKRSLLKKLLINYMPFKLQLLVRALINKKPKYLGKRLPKIDSSTKNLSEFHMSFNDLKKMISEIETDFKKPIYTEDEALGFYINRGDYS